MTKVKPKAKPPAIPEVELLRETLLRLGITPNRSADYIGISPAMPMLWLKGRHRPGKVWRAKIRAAVRKMEAEFAAPTRLQINHYWRALEPILTSAEKQKILDVLGGREDFQARFLGFLKELAEIKKIKVEIPAPGAPERGEK